MINYSRKRTRRRSRKTRRRNYSRRYSRNYSRRYSRRTGQKQVGGFCPPCVLMPLVKAGAVAGGAALGFKAMKQSSSMTKRTPKRTQMKTVLEQSVNGQNKKITITLDKLANKKAILKKNGKRVKYKGDPMKKYNHMIKRCETNGYMKC